MPFFFSRLSRVLAGTIAFCAGLLLSGCVVSDNRPAGQAATPSANAQPAANDGSQVPDVAKQKEAAAPVTLPLVDAMLADEGFAREVSSTLPLSDEELGKLRDAARNAVLMLTHDPAGDSERSTAAATDEAKKQIGVILGDERTERFFALVRQQWSADGEELATAKPNAVPTDSRIVVNAPAYRMDLFENGKLLKSYKIGIGYPEFPLPSGLRRARTIIFNPTWTPPDEPWVRGKLKPGEKIEAGSPLNPLGPIKIPIGSPSLIHGGKSPARLGTFASHGCVGLTNAQVQDFAMMISRFTGRTLSLADIKGYQRKNTQTREVMLTQPMAVELRYETIVVEDGKLKIYRDVYEKNTNTEANLRRVLSTFGVSLDSLDGAVRESILDGLAQMATDPGGKAIAAARRRSTSKTGGVTRNIKGKKEVVFEMPELAGKGYPTAVGIKL